MPQLEDGCGAYERALALHRRGQLDEAASLYREVLAREPSPFGSLHLLGVIAGQRSCYTEAVASYQRALVLRPAHRQALMGRGKAMWSLGQLTDALASYDAALEIEPDCSESLMNRGDILLAIGRRAEGVVSLRRAMACGADAERIRFVLASSGAEAAPGRAPAGYLKDLFDNYANRFDAELIEILRYRTPEVLVPLVLRHSPLAPLDILDLGCGTGLCGPLMRPIARRLTGVDLSANMLAQAEERGVYSDLECIDLTDYLARCDAAFDLVIAADVLIYLGDLGPVFGGVSCALRAGGRFAFSVEAGDAREWELAATRRYRHSRRYLERLGAEHGFEVEAMEKGVLRLEAGNPVDGHLALMRVTAGR